MLYTWKGQQLSNYSDVVRAITKIDSAEEMYNFVHGFSKENAASDEAGEIGQVLEMVYKKGLEFGYQVDDAQLLRRFGVENVEGMSKSSSSSTTTM